MSSTSQEVAKGARGELMPRVDIEDYFIVIKDGEKEKRLGAVDIAREAFDLQSTMDRAQKLSTDFSYHIVQLAAKCRDAATFRAVCFKAEMEMDWGSGNPIPPIWNVYKSTLAKAMEIGVRPGEEMEIPLLKSNKIVLSDKTQEPIRTKVAITGINAVKTAQKALKAEKKWAEGDGDEDEGDEDEEAEKRNPSRLLVEAFSRSTVPVDREASEVFQQLVNSYVSLDESDKKKFLRRVERILADYPAPKQAPTKH